MPLRTNRLNAQWPVQFSPRLPRTTRSQVSSLELVLTSGEIVQTGTPEDIVTQPADDYVADFVAGISKLKLVFAHTVMMPVEKFVAENGKMPAIKKCPQANAEDDLDTLVSLSVDQENPIVIMEDDKPVGVVTKDALLRGIQGEV